MHPGGRLEWMRDKRVGQGDCHLPPSSVKLSRLGIMLRLPQKSGDMGAGGSVVVGTSTCPAVLGIIMKEVAVAVAERLVHMITEVIHRSTSVP